MSRALACAILLLACDPESPPAKTPAPSLEEDASAPKKEGSALFVDDKRVDCEGDHPMKCLRTRASKDAEWELFYAPIEGFTFEEGYRYELRIDMSNPKKPKLVELISKTKTP